MTMVETGEKEVANKQDMPPETDSGCDNSQHSDEVGSMEECVASSGSNKRRWAQPSQSGPRKKEKISPGKGQAASLGKGAAHSRPRRATGKRRKTLERLPEMPFDIIYEILSYLTPRDLANVYLTKMFKEALDLPDAKAFWIQARKQYDAPEPPPGYSEAYWARLLFEPRCQECDAPNIHDADWKIRKRLCRNCKLDHLIGHRDKGFQSSLGKYPSEVFELTPCTNKRPFTQQTRDRNWETRKLYFDRDIHAVAARLASLSSLADTPEGSAALDAWKSRRRAFVESCEELADGHAKWEAAYQRQKGSESDDASKRRVDAVLRRFAALGYNKQDVELAFWQRPELAKGTTNVTDRVFTILKPKLEPNIQANKALRERLEKERAVESRIRILDELYVHYSSTLQPSELYICPRSCFLHPLPEVWQIIDQSADLRIGPEDFQPIVSQFPNLVLDYLTGLKESVAKRIASPPEDAFNLAKNVFMCAKVAKLGCGGDYWMTCNGVDQIMLGWPAVASHRCVEDRVPFYPPGSMDFKSRVPQCAITRHFEGSSVSSALVTLAGLNPSHATISEMDFLDPRFVLAPQNISASWVSEYPVFTWRGALRYFAERFHRVLRGPPSFKLATPEDAEKARQHTRSMIETQPVWVCNHCQDFYDEKDAQVKSVILTHLSNRHNISEPRVGVDYMGNPYLWTLLEEPCQFPLQFTTDKHFKCLRCLYEAQPGFGKWFDTDGIRRHLQQIHNDTPKPGLNFHLGIEFVTSYPG